MAAIRTTIALLLVLGTGVTLASCAPAPTDQELGQMCERLRVLRGEPEDEAAVARCVADSEREGVSQRQARCRISAVNKSEYWNRCSTGEPRQPQPAPKLEKAPATKLVDEEIERLRALGYVSGSEPPREGKAGVTVHDPARTTPGLNVVVSGHGHEASLMNAAGEILHTWRKPIDEALTEGLNHATHMRRAIPFPNGDVVIVYATADGLVKLDRCSNVLWSAPNQAHHDLQLQPGGEIYTLVRTAHVRPDIDPATPVLEDYVAVLGRDGKELRRVSLLDALKESEFRAHWEGRKQRIGDVFHTNSVDVLRGEPVDGETLFIPGRVLVSILHLDMVALLDMESERFVWVHQGSFDAQHDAQVLAGGRLLMFDNQGLGKASRALELKLPSGEIAWEYRGDRDHPFYSNTRGRVQRFANGNTLITETDSGRAFEVTRGGEIVWEYFNPERVGGSKQLVAALLDVSRLPPDFPTDWIGPCSAIDRPQR